MANKFTHPDKLIQKNLNNTPFDNQRNNQERKNKSIELILFFCFVEIMESKFF